MTSPASEKGIKHFTLAKKGSKSGLFRHHSGFLEPQKYISKISILNPKYLDM